MAVSKNNPNRGKVSAKDATYVKYVKKAKMWCRTTIKDGKQTIEFFSTKEEANA